MADVAVQNPASGNADAGPISPKTKKTAVKKAVPAAKKVSKKPSHPRTLDMVVAAVKNLKERNGSSLQAIKKYIAGNYKVDAEKLAPYIRKAVKSGLTSGSLVQTKGNGASGSFRLPTADKPDKKKSPAAKAKRSKPKKAPAAAKPAKPAAKKLTKKTTPVKKTKPSAPAAPVSPKKATPEKKVAKPKAPVKAKPAPKSPVKAKKAAKGSVAKKPKTPKPKKAAPKPKVAAKKSAAKK